MIVSLIAAGGTAAEGGVIVDRGEIDGRSLIAGDFSASDSPSPCQIDNGDQQGAWALTPASQIGGHSLVVAILANELFVPSRHPVRWITLQNALLPPSPLLDGLLKPG